MHQGASLLELADGESPRSPLISEAISYLQTAADLLPHDPLPLRYLARAYRASGQLEEAIAVLERAHALEPENLLVKKELMLAYQDVGRPNEVLEIEFGYSPDRLMYLSELGLESGHYVEVLQVYDLIVERWPEYYDRVLFCRIVAYLSGQGAVPVNLIESLNDTEGVVNGNGMRQIVPGAAFRWVYPGCDRQLNVPYGGSKGIFWNNGRGSLLISIDESAYYLLRIIVCDCFPPPIEMSFGINGQVIKYVDLVEGDNSWDEQSFVVLLSAPLVSLDVWFHNDYYLEGELDRNAIIQHVEIIRLAP